MSIANVAPTIELLADPIASTQEQYSIELLSIVDPGDDQVTDITIDWGDGSEPVTFTDIGTKQHQYPSAGIYLVQLTAVDEDGSFPAGEFEVMVNAGELVLESNFNGTTPAAFQPWTATNVLSDDILFSGWSLGAGFEAGDANDRFGFQGALGPNETTLADALDNDHYLTFTIEESAIGSLNLSEALFEFTIDRIGWHSPRTVRGDVQRFRIHSRGGALHLGENHRT